MKMYVNLGMVPLTLARAVPPCASSSSRIVVVRLAIVAVREEKKNGGSEEAPQYFADATKQTADHEDDC
jgi:hypothetical protein